MKIERDGTVECLITTVKTDDGWYAVVSFGGDFYRSPATMDKESAEIFAKEIEERLTKGSLQ